MPLPATALTQSQLVASRSSPSSILDVVTVTEEVDVLPGEVALSVDVITELWMLLIVEFAPPSKGCARPGKPDIIGLYITNKFL